MLIFSASALSAEKEKAAPKKTEVQSDITINDSLQRLLDVAGVKPIYEDCKSRYTERMEEIPNCIWTEVQKNPALKKEVLAVYASDAKKGAKGEDGRSPASTKTPLTTDKKAASVNYQSDPSVVALAEFYGKKLDEIISPEKGLTAEERKNNVILTVDHKKFVELYKSELGSTIISAFTSYCLDTDPKTCDSTPGKLCQISDSKGEAEKHRKKNIESLKGADLADGSAEGAKWKKCIVDVSRVCDSKVGQDKTEVTQTSRDRACLIVDYVKAARKNITIADGQMEFYDKLAKEGTTGLAGNMKIIQEGEKASSSSILSITKKDVEDNLKPVQEKNLKEIEGCYDDKADAIKDIEACKKFLSTNKEQNEGGLAEFGVRQLAQVETLTEELTSSDDRLKDYLKEEGHKDAEIEALMADKNSIDDIRNKIIERYKNEKEAIIKEMADKIKDKTATTEGTITQADKSKIQKIKKDIESRNSDFANLVQFNNVVSSYLSFGDEKNKTSGRNTASLFAETKTMDAKEAKEWQEKIKAAKLQENKDNNVINLDVSTINSDLLNYNNKLKDKKAKEQND